MKQEDLVKLIKEHCTPSNRVYKLSSYGLKNIFERLSGEYISNDLFKSCMVEAGFEPIAKTKNTTNHLYKIRLVGLNMEA